MKRKLLFLWSGYLILTLLDGWLTFYNTPDLSNEGNPLVEVLGLGWGALFVSNLLALALYILLTRYAFLVYRSPLLMVKNGKEFLSQLFFDRPDKFSWFFYRIPKNKKNILAAAGYALGFALPIQRALLIGEWLLVTFRIDASGYERFRELFHGHLVTVGTLLIYLCLAVGWYVREYRKNARRLAEQAKLPPKNE